MTLRPLLRPLAVAALAALAWAAPVSAQTTSAFSNEPEARGTSYFLFAEPGAPTIEIFILGEGTRNGIYRLQQGTSLVEAVALAGGTARSDSTERQISSATIRLVRETDGQARVIYQVAPERLLLERDRHPALESGDAIETEVTYEAIEIDEPFTFRDGLEIAGRVASLLSVVILLVTRLN